MVSTTECPFDGRPTFAARGAGTSARDLAASRDRELRQEVGERLGVEPGEPLKLHNVNPPLPGLTLGQVRLRLVQRLGRLRLGESGLEAGGSKPGKELSVSGRSRQGHRFARASVNCPAGSMTSLWRLSRYPKTGYLEFGSLRLGCRMASGREYRLDDPTPTVSNGGNADRTPGSDPCAMRRETSAKGPRWDADLSPSSPEAPDQVAVVRGQIDLFDFSIIDEVVEAGLRLNGQPPDAGDSSVWAISHRKQASRIRAMGLIDSTGGWMLQGTPGPVHEQRVEWAVPGPKEGPYASYTRLGYIDAECPKRVPLLMEFMPHDDAEMHAFSERALWYGLSADLVTNPLGWVKVRASRWRGELADAFPQRDVAHLLSSLERDRTSWGTQLPLVLGPGVLNADALGTMFLVLPTQQFLALRDQIVSAGSTLTAKWYGEMAFRQAWKPAIVSETSSLQVQTGANEASLEHMRANWELGVVFREAREQWLHRLPPIDQPWRSPIYKALRDTLGIAAQGQASIGRDPERAETMERVLNIVLECCFAQQMARHGEYFGLEQKAVVTGVTEAPENVLEHVLGTGWIDPWSYYLLHGPDQGTLTEIAERYERLPGMWSPAVSRALAHALLLAETSES